MRKNLKKLSILLALALLFTSFSISAYAGHGGGTNNNIQILNEAGSFEVCLSKNVDELSAKVIPDNLFSKSDQLETRLLKDVEKGELVYEVSLADKGYLDYSYDLEGKRINTAIVVYNEEGNPIGGIYIDPASKNTLSVDDNKIIQSISLTKNAIAELQAVSLTFNDFYFSSSGWITRAGEPFPLSLSLKPKSTGPWEQYPGAAWTVVMEKYGSDSRWENESGLYNQWYCHYLTVKFAKTPWNIEPKRPYANLSSTIGQGCNPE